MSEPTREEIKKAFKKTIERWEKIVEDVEFYECSDCSLCNLFLGSACDQKICPVGIYTKQGVCHGTPYWDFTHDKTPANALAELNFLRKVYIWWMEQGRIGVKGKPEEKKEEWEDVTGECSLKLNENCSYYYFQVFYDGVEVLFNEDPSVSILDKHPWSNNLTFLTPYYDKPRDIKVEISRGCFRILKKILRAEPGDVIPF